MLKLLNIGSIHKVLIIWVFLLISTVLSGQTDKKFIRKGNKEFDKNKFPESEISYRKAIDKNKQSPDAVFNVGDALYKQNKFEEAGKQFIENTNQTGDKVKKSAGLYNLGNSLLKANKYQESIEAYKNSLKLKPDNEEAKYNLSYAQDQLKKQQEQQKQQQDKQNKDKDNKKDNKNKDQKKDPDKDQNKDKNNDQNKDQNDQNNNQDKKDQQQQPQKQEISKDDAQRLLNSLANDEKNVQEKVKLAKAAKTKVRTDKNW